MVQTSCKVCKTNFHSGKQDYCNNCYEVQLLKCQCLTVAATLLPTRPNKELEEVKRMIIELKSSIDVLNSESLTKKMDELHEKIEKLSTEHRLFELAKTIFNKSKKVNFLGWRYE